MSNMYTILDSLKKVTPQQEPQENKKSQAIYESVEAKGSILEGVAKVEEKLKEQFANFNEGDTEYKNGVTKHKGTYGTEYQGDPDDEDAPKRGRPARGTAKKEKVVRVKGPKGRPKKDKPAEYSKSNDPFGRVPDKAPKGAKGTVVKGKATQDTVDEAAKNPYAIGMAQAKKETGLGRATAKNLPKSTIKRAHHIGDVIKTNESRTARLAKLLIEGVNFTEMIKKKDMTLQEMLSELQADIQAFKETGHCSELLRDCMEVHSYGKSQLNDATEEPTSNFPAPLAPAQAPSMMDRAKRMGGHILNKLGHGSDEDMKADLRRKMDMQEAAELNELARLAGLTVAEANDGNLANNAKPYDKVTQGDVIAGRLGKDEMGGKEEVAESDDESAHFANILRHTAQKFAQKAHQGDDGQFWTDQAGIVMKASQTIDQQGMEAGMQVLNDCDCWDALGDELELHDIDVQDLVDQYGLDQHAAGDDYRNFGSDYDGANEDPHGWDDVEEGNLFTKGLEDDNIKVGEKIPGTDAIKTKDIDEGETCPTCHSEPCACEDTEAADRELEKLKENCGITSPIGSMAQDMQQQQGRISVNTSQSSDGTKNISISADGEAADQLMQILKMAGMGGAQQQHAEVVIAAQPMEAKEYGNTDIEKPEEVLNTPREDVRGMHRAETVGYADTTDDLNKQKDQDPATANKAANPKTAKVNRVEESHPLESLGAKLMAEYQAIKITK